MTVEISSPLRVTPLFRRHVAAGAGLEEVHGWRVPGHYGPPEGEALRVRAECGLCDVSALGKFDLRGAEDDLGSLAAGRSAILRPGRGQRIVVCEPGDSAAVEEEIRRACAPGRCLHFTDVTAAFGALCLAGPRAREVLARLAELDLRPDRLADGGSTPASLANVPALFHRADLAGTPRFTIHVGWEHTEYAWDAVLEAGVPLGLRPFGWSALRMLG